MDGRRWEHVQVTFDAVIELEPSTRAERLAQLCGDDVDLRQRVERLLEGDERAADRLGRLEVALCNALGEMKGATRQAPDLFGFGGRVVSHFRVLESIGAGGMGVVYRADDLRLHRTVALKFMLPHQTAEPAAKARFIREARAAAALDHPNICTVYEVGESEDGHLFLAMPLYQGETLKDRLTRDGALSTTAALDVAGQVARGLVCAHAAGVVHRDLKPANLMLTPDGSVKILDFGLAKAADQSLTGSGAVMGSLGYMSPEQLRGDPVDLRTDLWSLGIVLFEMLTGQRPFRGDPEAIRARHVDARELRRLRQTFPNGIAEIVARLLRTARAQRYQTAEALMAALHSVADGAGVPRLLPERRFQARTWRALLGGVVLLVAALIGVLWRRQAAGPAHVPNERGTGGARVISLAVLPLRNYSGNPMQEYFAEGMTDALTTTLTKIEGLRVIAHQSMRQFNHSERPVSEIARLLDVQRVVDGSVEQDEDSVRITASLIDAVRNTVVWNQHFVRERRDVPRLHGEVALAIARAIEVALSPQDQARLVAASPVDPEAFDLYVKGTRARYAATRSRDFTESTRYLSQSIARDSTYAGAYAGVAFNFAFTGDATRARQFATKALELDPKLAEAHMVLGTIRQFLDWDWEGAENALREAIRLNPGYAEAHHELSMLLLRRRRFDEALREGQRTVYLAPMSSRFEFGIGEVYVYGGRYGDALAMAGKLLATDSSFGSAHFLRGLALEHQARYEEAIEAWQRCIEALAEGCDFARAHLGYIYGVTGRRAAASKVVDMLMARWRVQKGQKEGYDAAFHLATVYAGMGERERALDWLERAVARGTFAVYLGVEPTYRSLHAEPRYRALMKKVGLDD